MIEFDPQRWSAPIQNQRTPEASVWIEPIRIQVWGSAGWEGALLLYIWPGVIPALSLLSSIPRFVLRRAGWRVAPRIVVGLLILQWSAASLFTATARGSTDGEGLSSMFGNLFGIPEAAEVGLNIGFLVIVVLVWVATIVVDVGSVARARRGTRSIDLS